MHGLSRRGPKLFAACALVLSVGGLVTQLFPELVQAQPRPRGESRWVQINENGFGDCENTYSWSMAWYKDKLYVGTNRASDVQFLGDPDFHCQRDDFAAEIWRYTAETNAWERVFKSPRDVPIPGQRGALAARDNGFRDMILFEEATGREALYVGGVIYAVPGDPRRPRILRSTDGVTFKPIPQDPGTFLGDLRTESFRAMAVYKKHLYVTAGSRLGEGVILEAKHPAGGNNHFKQVSPPGLVAFELEVFNGFLYVGSVDLRGFSVLKTNARPTHAPYYNFIPVVTNGAFGSRELGRNTAVLSMNVFRRRLYVGSQSDLIRINPDDTWDLVVGNPRRTPQGDRSPISGLPTGFGNPFTGHLWRMQRHGRAFYVGTWDFAVFFRNWPFIGPIAALEAGFDLWTTRDGVFWSQITRNGFGNKFSHGVRTLVSTPFGLFLGTANPWDGTQVWLQSSPAGDRGPTTEPGQLSITPPDRLDAEGRGGSTVLSWDPSPGATEVHIFRAAYRPNREVGVPYLPEDARIPGPFTLMGTTTQSFFQDPTTLDGTQYAYYVQAEDQAGQVSDPSNVAIVPSLAAPVTFERLRTTILDLAVWGKVKAGGDETPLLKLLAAGRAAMTQGNLRLARHRLEALRQRVLQNPGMGLDPLAAEELEILVAKLVRRVEFAHLGTLSPQDLLSDDAVIDAKDP